MHRMIVRRRFIPQPSPAYNDHPLTGVCAEYFINSEDIGRLHVAAAIFDNVRDQRIFGFAGRVSWDAILGIFRKLEPERNFVADFSGGEDPALIEPREKAEGLLRDLGQPGWTSVEQSVAGLIEQIKEADAHGDAASK